MDPVQRGPAAQSGCDRRPPADQIAPIVGDESFGTVRTHDGDGGDTYRSLSRICTRPASIPAVGIVILLIMVVVLE